MEGYLLPHVYVFPVVVADSIRGHTAVKEADSVRPADLVKHNKLSVKVG